MKLMPYKSYSLNNEPWLNNLPQEWDLQLAKRIFKQRRVPSYVNDEQLTASQKYGVIPQKLFMEMEGQKVALAIKGTEAFKHVDKGDFLISLRSFQGGIEYCHYSGCVSPAYVCLVATKQINNKFYSYLFKCSDFVFRLQTLTDGLRDGKMISYEDFSKIKLPTPSLIEQEKIATFLDSETAKLDALISKQEKLIELLQEKRQAIISHAVTKGLDPNVKMKDSGVEWLGMVPEDWKILQFRHMVSIQNGSDYKDIESEDGPYPVIGSGGQFKKATNYIYDGASVLLGRKGTIDKPLYVEGKFWVVDTMFYTIIKEIVLAKYVFNCAKIIPFDLLSTSTALPSMTQNDLKTLCFAIPKTLSEQKSIIDFIENQTAKIDLLIEKATQSIDLAKEHRTALISAAVTGKIDVREYA